MGTKERNKQGTARINPGKGFIWVFLAASAMLVLKLYLSSMSVGTNDMAQWKYFADFIKGYGTFEVCKINSIAMVYNHPPLISWMLKLVNFAVLKTGFSFPYVFRLTPIFADYASIFIIWKLLGKYAVKSRTLLCIICSINPINFFISGFHGNTDSVFILLVLLAIYFVEDNSAFLAGLIYGLSICVKIVPVILAPLFIYYFKTKKDRIIFLLSALVAPLIVFIPYLIVDCHSLIRNIFLYGSLKGVWGLGYFILSIFNNENLSMYIRQIFYFIFEFYNSFSFPVFFLLIIFLGKILIAKRKTNLTEGVFLAFCLFLAITPGFGVQYLAWLSFFAVIASPVLGSIYLLMGGLFLGRIYAYWGAATFPHFADSYKVGRWVVFGNTDLICRIDLWVGFDNVLAIVLWLIVVAMLVKFISNKRFRKTSKSMRSF